MKKINAMILEIAGAKAKAAMSDADKVTINDVIFAQGLSPGEVQLDGGIDVLCGLLHETLHQGYIVHGGEYSTAVQWFHACGVKFYEEHYIPTDCIPENALCAEHRQDLYRLVKDMKTQRDSANVLAEQQAKE